jgi:hypothetical protein
MNSTLKPVLPQERVSHRAKQSSVLAAEFHAIVASAAQLIQAELCNQQLNAQLISTRQQVNPELLDMAFLHCRGRSCGDEIAISRASRLFKRLGDNPQHIPEDMARSCGFSGLADAGKAFRDQLGIEMDAFLHTSQRALQDRQLRREDPRPERLIVGSA